MAWAEVGGGSQRGSSGDNSALDSDTLAFPGNVTAGNLLVCGGAAWVSGAAPASIAVTDTRGNSWTVVLGDIPATQTWRTFLAYAVNVSSGACTVTVNPAGAASDFSYGIDEFSGGAATPADVNGGTTTGASGNNIADSITTTAADALILGVCSIENTAVITPGVNYTQISEDESAAGNQPHSFVFRIISGAAGAFSVDWVQAVDQIWAAQTHSFAIPSSPTALLPQGALSLAGQGTSLAFRIYMPDEA